MFKVFLASLICLLAFFTFSNTVLSHTQTQIIEMTPEGFEPDLVTVDVNATIIFVNKDSVDRWPASNNHPTHEIYSEFDPKKPIAVGDSWNFRPQKIGKWEYHDHMVPNLAGVIIVKTEEEVNNNFFDKISSFLTNLFTTVKNFFKPKTASAPLNDYTFPKLKRGEDTNAYVRKQLLVCLKNKGSNDCYKNVAQLFYDQFGLVQSLILLKENENHPEVYARCHEVTHFLSRNEYSSVKDIAKVYAKCDATCHGGCYHGTLEAYLKEQQSTPGFDLNVRFANICGKLEDYQKPFEYYECLHGLGHAAMFITDMELLSSLGLCDTIPDQKYRERCFSGVFMENSSSSTSRDHISRYLKKDDPLYPCNALDEKYQALCWQYQSSYFAIISNQDWRKVTELCLQIPEKYQYKCFLTVGTNQVGFTPDLKVMKADCDLMPSAKFVDICVVGVVSSLSYRFVGDMQKMIDFCSIVKAKNQKSCYKQIGTSMLDWNSDKNLSRQNCAKIPDRLGASFCTSAI